MRHHVLGIMLVSKMKIRLRLFKKKKKKEFRLMFIRHCNELVNVEEKEDVVFTSAFGFLL